MQNMSQKCEVLESLSKKWISEYAEKKLLNSETYWMCNKKEKGANIKETFPNI